MKISQIEVGQEYVLQVTRHARKRHVRVVGKGLGYGDLKGQGVRVEYHETPIVYESPIVLSRMILEPWADHAERRAKKQAERKARQAHGAVMRQEVAPRLRQAFAAWGIEARADFLTDELWIRVKDADAAKKLLAVLEGE